MSIRLSASGGIKVLGLLVIENWSLLTPVTSILLMRRVSSPVFLIVKERVTGGSSIPRVPKSVLFSTVGAENPSGISISFPRITIFGGGENQLTCDIELEVIIDRRRAHDPNGGSPQASCGWGQETDGHRGIAVAGNRGFRRVNDGEIGWVRSDSLEEKDLQWNTAQITDGELAIDGSGACEDLPEVSVVSCSGRSVSVADHSPVALDLNELCLNGADDQQEQGCHQQSPEELGSQMGGRHCVEGQENVPWRRLGSRKSLESGLSALMKGWLEENGRDG